ncbi:hypothetical protein FQN57_005776 [Myotisia sp. PD_48]|nr:hypothetical protein FQN57_005776 [Myotisia sp. PD_48]
MALKIALITGGAGDIGRALAAKLSESHSHVILVDLDPAKLITAIASLSSSSSSCTFSGETCDVTDAQQVALLAQRVGSSPGDISTLVSNAGGTSAWSMQSMTPAAWRSETSLNLDAHFLVFHSFQDALKRTRGCVVNIASVNGLAIYGNPAYSAAKAGLIHLTRSIAVEYGKFGIRANAIAPGSVQTAAWEERAKINPDVFKDAAQWYPLGRITLPQDVANAAAFLSSEQAAAISGVCLPVDCGLSAGHAAIAKTITQSEDFDAA